MKQIRASSAVAEPASRGARLARRLVGRITGLLAALLVTAPCLADTAYPERAITIIVPFAAGGPTDIVARIVAGRLAMTFGQQIIVENVVGAGGTTAAIRAMRAPPDGYTLLMGHMGTHGSAPAVYPQLAYDPIKDFAPVGLVAGMPLLVLTKKEHPAASLADLIHYLGEHAETTTMAHAGIGSVSYATCTLLNTIAEVHPPTKAFQGTGPALQALAAGRADYMCDQIVSAAQRVKTGEIRALAIVAAKRSPVLPDVPTAAEAGVPNFKVSAWNALFAPKGTPADRIDSLNAALSEALDDPDISQELVDLGSEIPPAEERRPAALTQLVEREVARWRRLLQPAATTDRERTTR